MDNRENTFAATTAKARHVSAKYGPPTMLTHDSSKAALRHSILYCAAGISAKCTHAAVATA